MQMDRMRKWVAVAAVVAGIAWIGRMLPPLFCPPESGHREFFDWFFVCAIGPLMAIPGLGAIVWGVRFFRRRDFAALKGLVGLASVIGMFALYGYVPMAWAGTMPSSVVSGIGGLAVACAATLVYLVLAKWLLPLFGEEKRRLREYLSRPIFGVLAFLLWQLLSALAFAYQPAAWRNEVAWMLTVIFGPTTLVWGGYRVVVARLLPAKAKDGGKQDESGRS